MIEWKPDDPLSVLLDAVLERYTLMIKGLEAMRVLLQILVPGTAQEQIARQNLIKILTGSTHVEPKADRIDGA